MTSTAGDLAQRPLAAALAAAVAAVEDAGSVETWGVADAEVAAGLAQLEHLCRLAEAQKIEWAAEASSRGLPPQSGYRHLNGWLRSVLPTPASADLTATARRAEALYRSPVSADL